MNDKISLARRLVPVAQQAGAVELRYYRAGAAMDGVMDKTDGSPVTLADQEAEKLIIAALADIVPDVPVVGEESVAAGSVPDIAGGRFFLVDPLDGTRDFIAGGGDFTVNIALMENFKPVMGLIYVPVTGIAYFAAGDGAFRQSVAGGETKINTRPAPAAGLTVVTGKRYGDPEALRVFLMDYPVAEKIGRSSSLKFCSIAAGEADLYPRLGPTSEWDTAAGEAILTAAGGIVTTLTGAPMTYGKAGDGFLNPPFIARTL